MKKEKLDKLAKEFAWAHDTIGVDKETFSRDCPDVMKMVRIPVNKEMEHAYKCGAVWWGKEIIEEAVELIRWNNENGGCKFDGWEESFRKRLEINL